MTSANCSAGGWKIASTFPGTHRASVEELKTPRGNSGTYTALWTVESGKISRRLGVQTAQDNAGNCSGDANDASKLERCQEHSLAITFEPGTRPDCYDIHLQPSDPAWPYGEKDGYGHDGGCTLIRDTSVDCLLPRHTPNVLEHLKWPVG